MNGARLMGPPLFHSDRRSVADAGSYRRDDLMARFGADIALPDLLVALASCDRRRDFTRLCGARYTDLASDEDRVPG